MERIRKLISAAILVGLAFSLWVPIPAFAQGGMDQAQAFDAAIEQYQLLLQTGNLDAPTRQQVLQLIQQLQQQRAQLNSLSSPSASSTVPYQPQNYSPMPQSNPMPPGSQPHACSVPGGCTEKSGL